MNTNSITPFEFEEPGYRLWGGKGYRLFIPTTVHEERLAKVETASSANEAVPSHAPATPSKSSGEEEPDFSHKWRHQREVGQQPLYLDTDLRRTWDRLNGTSPDREIAKRDRHLVNTLLRVGPWRSGLLKDDVERSLEDLTHEMAHFRGPIEDLRDAATLALRSGRPLVAPPLLLLGPPGIGKTHFTRMIAESMGLPTFRLSLDASNGPSALSGSSRYWSNTRTGLVFHALAQGKHMSPVILLDELDKAPRDDRLDPLRSLHGLLEPVTARTFEDESFPLPIDARYIVWIATANDIDRVEPSLLSRFVIHRIEEPDQDQRFRTARTLFQQLFADMGPAVELDVAKTAIEKVAQANPRQQRVLVRRAVARALRAHRECLQPEDVPETETSAAPRRVGFLR
ncbi:AAA family ATPase [Thiomonas intermedia]|uniref:AAA family ATPase n=1 Tax=Thiomonas intermedia TaxID=926 RepID=UPI0009A51218|nr:AAA family ATPase [Thiomonas intermedia]